MRDNHRTLGFPALNGLFMRAKYGLIVLISLVFCLDSGAADRATDLELDDFCANAQMTLAATSIPVVNSVYDEPAFFVKSKASARPLVARQLVRPDDQGLPRMISCKVKTADNIIAEYGHGAAGAEGTCRSINYQTLQQIVAASESAERPYGEYEAVILEEDEVGLSGVYWLKPYDMIWREGNKLHIRSKALVALWDDERFLSAPPRFRGNHYCHLVAPSYLRRVLNGEVGVPARDM